MIFAFLAISLLMCLTCQKLQRSYASEMLASLFIFFSSFYLSHWLYLQRYFICTSQTAYYLGYFFTSSWANCPLITPFCFPGSCLLLNQKAYYLFYSLAVNEYIEDIEANRPPVHTHLIYLSVLLVVRDIFSSWLWNLFCIPPVVMGATACYPSLISES